jgi:hypothetical protein
VALADPAADAAPVPVTFGYRAALVVATLLALGSGLGTQRRVLPFDLKAGRHQVILRPTGSSESEWTLWTPADTGAFPMVILVGDVPTALDTVLPEYLATHGFAVARVHSAAAISVLPFPESSHAVVVRWGRSARATAILDFDPDGAGALSIETVGGAVAPPAGLRVALPRSPSGSDENPGRRYRLLCAVTHAVLNAVLRGVGPTVPELAARLRAAGLVTELALAH